MGTQKTTTKTEATLEQLRFRKLVRALHAHGTGMSAAAIAAKLDVDPKLIGDVIAGDAHVDEQTVDRAIDAFGVHHDFFQVEDLGEYTTHEHFVGRSPFAPASSGPKSETDAG